MRNWDYEIARLIDVLKYASLMQLRWRSRRGGWVWVRSPEAQVYVGLMNEIRASAPPDVVRLASQIAA